MRKACRIANVFNDHGVRKYGVIRIDSAEHGVQKWRENPVENTRRIADTFKKATTSGAHIKLATVTKSHSKTTPAANFHTLIKLPAGWPREDAKLDGSSDIYCLRVRNSRYSRSSRS